MCTVVIEVPETEGASMRLLAVRDEDPARPWDPPGYWWDGAYANIVGVHDRRAGGAWLAADLDAQRVAVLLNRAPTEDVTPPEGGYATRGTLALHAAAGETISDAPATAPFNLISLQREPEFAAFTFSWNGVSLTKQQLAPGVHMIAHHDINDAERTPRIAAWLPAFRELAGMSGDWRSEWIRVLAETAHVPASDDRAILRDNRVHGYPTQSLLACIAEIGPDGAHLDTAVFAEPASDAHEVELDFKRFAPRGARI